jgi:hypothetical protein
MASVKYTGGGKYKPEMCKQILEHYVNGESDAEVAVALDVSRQMFYRWIKEKPEFAEAVQRGKTLSECWWQRLGRAGASGKVKIQARVYIANMNNRFGWRENPIEDEKQDDNIQQIADAIKALNLKHERDY